MKKGFTLIELLVSVTIASILAALSTAALSAARVAQSKAISAHTLHQLMVGGHCYLADYDNLFWPYKEYLAEGTQWWFGFETWRSIGAGEGNRTVDYERGPLSGAMKSSSLLTDPVFLQYSPRLKPKYKNGDCGYGYNTDLAANRAGGASAAAVPAMEAVQTKSRTLRQWSSLQRARRSTPSSRPLLRPNR